MNHEQPQGEEEYVPSRRASVMAIAGLAASLLLAALSVVPVPYEFHEPGTTFDVLGDYDGEPAITVSGEPTYDPSGEMRITTVAVSRGTSSPLTLGYALKLWWSQTGSVTPILQGPTTSDDQQNLQDEARVAWVSSQEKASVAALEELGELVPTTVEIIAIDENSFAFGILEEGDTIVAVEGEPLASINDLSRATKARSPGEDLTLAVNRAGEGRLEFDIELTEYRADGAEPRALIGIVVQPYFDLPVTLNVGINNVGGPSAGMMFSLAIINYLTPEDELDGALIAGTGTIETDGTVGNIGGIPLKLAGARAAGAEWFLAPRGNCAEVRGHIPNGLRVISVENIHEARLAMEAIGAGTAQSLPTCEPSTYE